ncbi:MAG: hypothetical protein F6K23_19440 [Okeania sp. SIO2C9]|uniref:hypothetical protein n=1 Tax=Okeania sp. SIO2C9 TaxID=2607791 RepID=UPI0013C0EFC4|nr:hypothetical protein [Okeania sp. SIO2C9]NEQ75019.1 hypothetical protein [Okeania sp. SIO2C9]
MKTIWYYSVSISYGMLRKKLYRIRLNSYCIVGRWGDGEMGRWGDGEMGRLKCRHQL